MHNISGDYISSCKSNYDTITSTSAPSIYMALWSIGLKSSHVNWKAKVNDERAKTALVSKYARFELSHMVFGICNYPATYVQELLRRV